MVVDNDNFRIRWLHFPRYFRLPCFVGTIAPRRSCFIGSSPRRDLSILTGWKMNANRLNRCVDAAGQVLHIGMWGMTNWKSDYSGLAGK
jgi:hypothetical protein